VDHPRVQTPVENKKPPDHKKSAWIDREDLGMPDWGSGVAALVSKEDLKYLQGTLCECVMACGF
jgi:hypothetical protein